MEITNSKAAAQFLRSRFVFTDVEEFWAIALDPACRVLACRMLFRGTVDACFIHPRDVFRFGLQANASSLIVGHNHPSGSCGPSQADIELSGKLKAAGELLRVPVADHVIVTVREHFSFADRGWPRGRH